MIRQVYLEFYGNLAKSTMIMFVFEYRFKSNIY